MPEQPEANEPQCPHTALTPHWEEPNDMGKPELATYTCEACGETFAYAEAQRYLNKPPAVLTGVAGERREYDASR